MGVMEGVLLIVLAMCLTVLGIAALDSYDKKNNKNNNRKDDE